MASTDPHKITDAEWREIMTVPAIRDAWGVEPDEAPQEFSSVVYGVRFDYQSGGPGYRGDLFILQGDAEDHGAVVLRRNADGGLEVAHG